MGNKQIINLKEKISKYQLYYKNENQRCITSFAILKNNKILLTFKGGIIVIYEFIKISEQKKEDKFILKEIINVQKDEYCFNYGIELKNGNLAICSEDSTINIFKLIFNKNCKKKIDNNNNNNNQNYDLDIIQNINLGDYPLYIIKEFTNEELVIGSWNHIYIFIILKNFNKYELVSNLIIKDRTFSLIELNKGEIISSQCYSKTLTIYDMQNHKFNIIKNIESNENPNIICKYNNKNDIVFVAFDKGINIVSIINKCLIEKFTTKEIISSICPFISHLKQKEILTILCGTKERIYNANVNYKYNLIQICFDLKEEINKNKKNSKVIEEKKIKGYRFPGKESIHYYDIKQIENIMFCNNNIFDIKKEEQIIITIGSEDKNLIFWRNHK